MYLVFQYSYNDTVLTNNAQSGTGSSMPLVNYIS